MNSSDCLNIIRQHLLGVVGDPPKLTMAKDVAESVMLELEKQGSVSPGFEVEVTRNPHSPDVLDIRALLQPAMFLDQSLGPRWWCWGCGSTAHWSQPMCVDCGKPMRNRPRHSVDDMEDSLGSKREDD